MTTRSPDVIEEFLDEAQFELRHEAQRRSFAWYLTGLLGPLERKSVVHHELGVTSLGAATRSSIYTLIDRLRRSRSANDTHASDRRAS